MKRVDASLFGWSKWGEEGRVWGGTGEPRGGRSLRVPVWKVIPLGTLF